MAENVIPADLLALLRQVDTPTACNTIEVAQGKRGFNRFTRGTMQRSKPGDPAMVGFARTTKFQASCPPVNQRMLSAHGVWITSDQWPQDKAQDWL